VTVEASAAAATGVSGGGGLDAREPEHAASPALATSAPNHRVFDVVISEG